jgi:dGTPase
VRALDAAAVRWGLDPDEVGGYEGNAQTFRLVTARLTGHSDLPGLNLTRATLDAALKYPWARGEVSRSKWCFYPSELEEAARVREGVDPERRYRRSVEAQVMDWADDVAYAVHDIEDFTLAGAIPLALLTQSPARAERVAAQLVARRERRGKLAEAREASAPSRCVSEPPARSASSPSSSRATPRRSSPTRSSGCSRTRPARSQRSVG